MFSAIMMRKDSSGN